MLSACPEGDTIRFTYICSAPPWPRSDAPIRLCSAVYAMTIPPRPKILGIGYPKFAIDEFNELAKKYEIHCFHPDDRAQVIGEVKRLSEQHGPFDASWVVRATSERRIMLMAAL